ncbi:hypothetical protein [Ewingella americana]|uniref:hypothetical protein n=1 Tax=Ewingella americana TaxID=41202 RepID=UPI001639A0A9|nr:hypothetical protein [Ewingella americana]QMV51884.1 hypothetical protein GXP68_11360 [Ewingella americana]
MALNYLDLDQTTRQFMSEEIQYDKQNDRFYLSNYLTTRGKEIWPTLLEEAIQQDDAWLEKEIQNRGLLAEFYPRRKPKSEEMTQARVPYTAAQTLAEGEFNRLYARGLSSRAISEGDEFVEAYRARHSEKSRPESEAIIGAKFKPQNILDDLRNNTGVETALGVPPGPNSGISIKRVK